MLLVYLSVFHGIVLVAVDQFPFYAKRLLHLFLRELLPLVILLGGETLSLLALAIRRDDLRFDDFILTLRRFGFALGGGGGGSFLFLLCLLCEVPDESLLALFCVYLAILRMKKVLEDLWSADADLDDPLPVDLEDGVHFLKLPIIGLKFIGRNELLRAVVRDADQAKKVRIWFAAAAY